MSGLIPHYAESSSQAARLLSVAHMLSGFPDLPRRKKEVYSLWIMGYLGHLDRRDVDAPRPKHIRLFLKWLSDHDDTDRAMRRQAAEALVFFHACVLDQQVGEMHGRIDMMSDTEREEALASLTGQERLLAHLVFETELDLTEALRLRVGDVDLTEGQIVVTTVGGCAERFVRLEKNLTGALAGHLRRLERRHRQDLKAGTAVVDLPPSVKGMFPGAESAWVWQFVFPADETTVDLRSGLQRRYPMHPARLLDILDRRTTPMTRVMEPVRDGESQPLTLSDLDNLE
jgi:integrase